MGGRREEDYDLIRMAGGVYATVQDGSVLLSILGCAPRGIPRKDWKIPAPIVRTREYCYSPVDDAIAFIDLQDIGYVHRIIETSIVSSFRRSREERMEIHLKTMSDGGNHPAARRPVIHYSRSDTKYSYLPSSSLTSSRLAVVAGMSNKGGSYVMIIWDWKNAQVLFVCQLFTLVRGS